MRRVTVYTDYKSPYAYLAKDLAYELERDLPVRLEWLPYVLDIPSFLGSARIDADGTVLEESRNAHQWRRVRYSYMDCRRQARKRGLVIRGPQKIWDFGARGRGDAVRAARRRRGVPSLPRRRVRTLLAARAGHRGRRGHCRRSQPRQAPTARRSPCRRRPGATRWPRSAVPPRPSACSACRASSSMTSCSGAASICPTFARCWRPDEPQAGEIPCAPLSFATATSS